MKRKHIDLPHSCTKRLRANFEHVRFFYDESTNIEDVSDEDTSSPIEIFDLFDFADKPEAYSQQNGYDNHYELEQDTLSTIHSCDSSAPIEHSNNLLVIGDDCLGVVLSMLQHHCSSMLSLRLVCKDFDRAVLRQTLDVDKEYVLHVAPNIRCLYNMPYYVLYLLYDKEQGQAARDFMNKYARRATCSKNWLRSIREATSFIHTKDKNMKYREVTRFPYLMCPDTLIVDHTDKENMPVSVLQGMQNQMVYPITQFTDYLLTLLKAKTIYHLSKNITLIQAYDNHIVLKEPILIEKDDIVNLNIKDHVALRLQLSLSS